MRRVCFVTGTRAEYGLMRTTLAAIRSEAALELQLIATGVHLDPSRGHTVDQLDQIDAIVPWPVATRPTSLAAATGRASADMAEALERLSTDVVLLVGDRVEALAAAMAGHLSNRIVAHVHGGDRAAGQADDAMRHAITKLAHLHFPATPASADRVLKLGEDRWRIHQCGTPGIDGIAEEAEPAAIASPFALLVLHPTRDNETAEYRAAGTLLEAVLDVGVPRVEVVWPNGDLGAGGITRRWDEAADDERVQVHRDLPRPTFLRLMRDAAFLAGNSSSGIIEAATFGTPVLDIGPRQAGRERSDNVIHANEADVPVALANLWNNAHPRRFTGTNVYGGGDAGQRICRVLASFDDTATLRHKLIAY